MNFPANFDATKFDDLLSRGLCQGAGDPAKQVCINVAIALACGEEPTDEPTCVHPVVRRFSIRLNDARWSSEKARADGMRALGLAQLGTTDIDTRLFVTRLAEATIREVVPLALRKAAERNPKHAELLEAAAVKCAADGTRQSALDARNAAAAADAAAYAYAYAYAAAAADAAAADAADAYAYAYAAADAAADAAYAADADLPLILSAKIATRILNEMTAGS